MYELVEKISVIAIAVIGVLMIIAPKKVARKSFQESKSKLMFVRILGVFITIGSIAVLLMLFGVFGF